MPETPDDPIKAALTRQYDALFAMLDAAIVQCPDDAWTDASNGPAGWKLTFHTLHFTDAYLCAGWDAHSMPDFADDGAFLFEPYKRPDGTVFDLPDVTYDKPTLRGYLKQVNDHAHRVIEALDIDEPSPFSHIEGTRLDVLIYNVRHASHHVGQLSLVTRRNGGGVVRWSRNGEAVVG